MNQVKLLRGLVALLWIFRHPPGRQIWFPIFDHPPSGGGSCSRFTCPRRQTGFPNRSTPRRVLIPIGVKQFVGQAGGVGRWIFYQPPRRRILFQGSSPPSSSRSSHSCSYWKSPSSFSEFFGDGSICRPSADSSPGKPLPQTSEQMTGEA